MPDSLRPLSMALSDVCFVHWPVRPAAVRALVPDWTEPDEFDGTAWVSAVALSVERFDAFGVPLREGVEVVTLRTYVRTPAGDRAVAFLAVAFSDALAAGASRSLFRMPARRADVRRREGGGRTEVVVRERRAATPRLGVTFEPAGEPTRTAPDTVASFLVDRERYVATGPLGTRLVGSVGHPPWTVQPAEATVSERSLLDAAGVDAVDGDPLVHYSPGLEMTVGALEPL